MNPSRPALIVVDDEPEVLRSLHDLLRFDYRVRTFTDPNEALEALEAEDAAVVMSDQRMPRMSGVEFLRRAKQLRPDTTRLLFTGYSDIKAVVDAINEGNVFRYISKPWDPDELGTILRQAVGLHDLVVERRRLIAELQDSNARLTEANRVKSAFIEVASHELNTPVAIVLGLAELWKLSEGPGASPEQHAWIDRMRGAAKRLADIVGRMLKLLRAEQFDHTLDLEPTDLTTLLGDVVAGVGPFLEARGQTVAVEAEPELGTAEIDRAKLSDALTNLIVNAIKFSPDGATIRLAANTDGDDWVRFRVIDPGLGISAADRRHLFEPFFTSYDTLRHSSGEFQFGKRGIGLGLHLVKTFAELHGGTVDVASEPGTGSTFSIRIPRRPGVAKAAWAI
jgi:signal transduction histidine kinase